MEEKDEAIKDIKQVNEENKKETKTEKKNEKKEVKIDNKKEKKDNKSKKEEEKNKEKSKVKNKVKNDKNNKKKNKEEKEKKKKEKTENKNKASNKEKNINKNVNVEEQNDDLTFKRVEMKEEKKDHKVLKFFLILLMILIAAYCVFFSRNFIILDSIYDNMCEIEGNSNYSYEVTKIENGEQVSKITYYKKDNVERVDIQDKDKQINTITDLEENQVTTWNPETKEASIYNTTTNPKIRLPLEESINYQESRAFMGLTSLIYSEECNSKDCYVIVQLCSPSSIDCSQKTWIDKSTGLVVKREYLNCVVEYNNIEMNNVDIVETPDLRDYKIENEE